MTTDNELVRLSIQDAVRPPEGNGLSSRAFQPPFNFMLIFSWINVENGVESIVFNGNPITKTELKSDLLRLIGRKRYFHRVLLKPSPLTVQREAISKDKLHVQIKTSVKYEVINPSYVCSIQSPLVELTEIVSQAVADCISVYDSHDLLSQNKQIRNYVHRSIQDSQIVKNNYEIIEVLQILPIIDERYIEIQNEISEAEIRTTLIDIDGEKRVKAAGYDTRIRKENEEVNQEILDKQHIRNVELKSIEENSETFRAGLDVLKGLALGGIDPTTTAKNLLSFLDYQSRYRSGNPKIVSAEKNYLPSSIDGNNELDALQIEKEMGALESIKEKIGILTYDVTKIDKGIFALLQFERFEIHFVCGSNYPKEEPIATIRYLDDTEKTPENYWIPGVYNLLAQALINIIPQA